MLGLWKFDYRQDNNSNIYVVVCCWLLVFVVVAIFVVALVVVVVFVVGIVLPDV